jgi:hypothetical protein
MKYLKRVSSELEAIEGGPEEEELMLQGVRFAFRVHQVLHDWLQVDCVIGVVLMLRRPYWSVQFAGGFDADTMRAFQEIKEKASMCPIQRQTRSRHMRQQGPVART